MQRNDGIIIPQIWLRIGQLEGEEKRGNGYKRIREATGKWVQKNWREKGWARTRERIKEILFLSFYPSNPFHAPWEHCIFIYESLIQFTFVFNLLLDSPIVEFFPSFIN